MLELKSYQKRTVQEFESYLDSIRQFGSDKGHDIGFYMTTQKKYKSQGLGKVPYVCIKIPTGGGKTLVACHILYSIYEKFAESRNQKGLVLWLVPTNAIKTQTINALRNRNHPYREILDKKFSNNILIMDVKQALSIKKSDIQDNLCIIVSTVSAFRIKDKEGRKVYGENGSLLEHFEDISDDLKKILKKDEDDQITISLMNVIRMSNPIIIADEGHHVKTDLSTDMFKEMNPEFVVEYTATPMPESNILVNVTAGELKEEKMVKIPLWLKNIAQWQQTIRDGVTERDKLESIAKKEKGEYIRPIALIQAEQEKIDAKKIHVDKIVEFLKDDCKIPEEQIAIRTGTKDELTELGDGIFEKDCPIRYIITVAALKEGWDNSFAYVLISVANIGAKIAVEQVIGRILRLPHVKEKKHEELNCSYVFTSSRNFSDAANNLEKGLLANGYSTNDFKELTGELTETVKKFNVFKKSKPDKDIKIPFFAVKDDNYRKLEFYGDLIGNEFDLSKQKLPDEFDLYYDQDRVQKIDIKDDKFVRSEQMKLPIVYDHKDFSKDNLLFWLDKKVLKKQYSQEEKRNFFVLLIDFFIGKKGYTISELAVNCFKLKSVVENYLDTLEENAAKIKFDNMIKNKEILLNKEFLDLPEEVTIDNICEDVFNNHLYEMAGKLNSEERTLVLKIDCLDNISWWYRSPEKSKQAISLQGWHHNKFYPDFVVKTKKGNYVLVEYKGEALLTNIDTEYKIELGEKWEKVTSSNYFFRLVSKDKIEEFIVELQSL